MTTRVQQYIDGLMTALQSDPDFPAALETSTLRAFRRDDYPVLVIHRGKEAVSESSTYGQYRRIRELCFTVHTAGDDREEDAEKVFASLQPIVMGYSGTDLNMVDEIGTGEPMFAQADRDRMATTKRFAFIYTTADSAI